MSMELQIRSTLNVLRSGYLDESIQVHGLRFLVDTCSSKATEEDMKEVSLVETVLTSFKSFPDNKTVKCLCCSVLITFARFHSCIEEARKFGVLEVMMESVEKEDDSKTTSLELAVMSAFGVNDGLKETLQSPTFFSRILRIEEKWINDRIVLQQLLGVFIIISSNKYTHHDIIPSALIKQLPTLLKSFESSYEIMSGFLSLSNNLSQSKEGKNYLYSIRIFSLIYSLSLLNLDDSVCCCISKLIISMNRDKAYRGEVVSDVGCAIVISLLECCKKNPMATREVMVAIRSICSAEQESIQSVLNSNLIHEIVITIQSFSKDEIICAHGIRALEWVLRAGQGQVVTLMVDDGVIGLCSGLLLTHHNLDVTRYVCGCLTKSYKYTTNISIVVKQFMKDHVLENLKTVMKQYKQNESLVIEYINFLANTCSNQDICESLVKCGIIEELVLCGNSCQLPETAVLVTGILWKCSLIEDGRRQILEYNGVDTILKVLQQFILNVVIHQNGLGCLSLLIQGDVTICDVIRRRLGISLVMDSMENFMKNPKYCVNVLTFFQLLTGDKNCYQVMLDRNICGLVLNLLRVQQSNITVSSLCFIFLDSLLGEDEGLYQLCCQKDVRQLIQMVISIHKASDPVIETLGTKILEKCALFNSSL